MNKWVWLSCAQRSGSPPQVAIQLEPLERERKWPAQSSWDDLLERSRLMFSDGAFD